MAGRLDGKVALITGACSGIGLATARLWLAEGAAIVAADVQDAKGAMLEQLLGERVAYARCDVTREDDIARAVDTARTRFGGLDILFNNAGTPGVRCGIEETDADEWDRSFALLVRGPMLGIKHAAPLMRARGGGAIVNTASIAGQQAGLTGLAYSAAKAAVIQMTKVAAAELSPQRIRINALCPGLIATAAFGTGMGMERDAADRLATRLPAVAARAQPLPQAGLPEHVAEAALFLASDAASFVTGTHLVVDGGLTIGPPSAWQPGGDAPMLKALGLSPDARSAPTVDLEHVE